MSARACTPLEERSFLARDRVLPDDRAAESAHSRFRSAWLGRSVVLAYAWAYRPVTDGHVRCFSHGMNFNGLSHMVAPP